MSQQANTDMTGKMSAKLGRPGWMLATYGLLGRFSAPVWRLALSVRKRRNKETDTSVTQKLGAPSATRPSGQLVWLHGVSVGESMALRPLIAALSNSRPELHFLLTSSTTTSAAALLQNGLPPRTIHQFAPVDTKSAVDAFLNHWQPDAVAFSERDFWPGLIRWTQEWGQLRNVAPLLINSRMSQDSLKRRTRGATLFRDLLRGFPKILLQDEGSQARFVSLGVPANQLEIVGSIKAAAEPLPDLPEISSAFAAAIGDRPRWVAASTHAQEVDTIVQAHLLAKKSVPDLLTIVAPRKPDVFAVQAEAAKSAGLKVVMRSEMPASLTGADMLIVDAIGEMGVWFRASDLVFMGFSMPSHGSRLTGKNPFEALVLGAAVLHGPDTTNFAENYASLDAAGATRMVDNVEDLATVIVERDGLDDLKASAAQWLIAAQKPLERTAEVILEALDDKTDQRGG